MKNHKNGPTIFNFFIRVKLFGFLYEYTDMYYGRVHFPPTQKLMVDCCLYICLQLKNSWLIAVYVLIGIVYASTSTSTSTIQSQEHSTTRTGTENYIVTYLYMKKYFYCLLPILLVVGKCTLCNETIDFVCS